ncbi:TetR/AcrR family transcriptional regulator [Hydrogenophaga sp.]|uniref:TetR/AcrR family transcriptional regulator n=1 Tax=Hydrogenophaga sp. TaxID=1904254 RepID=UPI003D117D2E
MVKRTTKKAPPSAPQEQEPVPSARTKRAEVTRTLLLDTAERLFALQGYDATGVRQIAEEAGVNLGAIHYYWRTKEMLCRDALERRLVPMLKERVQGLDDVQATGGGLSALFDASHRPSLMAGGVSGEEASSFRRFYGRMLFDPSPEVQAILASLLDEYAVRFVQMLRAECGDLSDNEFYWRVTFMYGAFLYAHTQHTRTTALWGGRFDQSNFADASRFLTRFLEGAMRAPPSDEKGRTHTARRDAPERQKAAKKS